MSETKSGKAFASQGDLSEKKISFTEVGAGLWAFTAEGDPNTGVIIGDDSVMIVDAQATPRLAAKVIEKIRTVTDKPIKYVVLSHYHAVRVLGASAYGASEVIMSEKARAMVAERGKEDWDSEFQRFPRLFQEHESIPGLTWPTLTFNQNATFYLGRRRVDLRFLGRAHTAGDIVAYVPDANVMFTGDIVEYHSACYCGDAHFTDWPATLEAIRTFDVDAIAPGRGDALVGKVRVEEALDNTIDFVKSTYRPIARAARGGGSLKEAWDACRDVCDPKFGSYAIYEHCLPFNVARAYDEALGIDTPRIWTAERDLAMWSALQG
jgi:glyoxylase-like metal-dependent hydrolase (beta-lactamase superfamily II)